MALSERITGTSFYELGSKKTCTYTGVCRIGQANIFLVLCELLSEWYLSQGSVQPACHMH